MQMYRAELFAWIIIGNMDVDGHVNVQNVTRRPKQA